MAKVGWTTKIIGGKQAKKLKDQQYGKDHLCWHWKHQELGHVLSIVEISYSMTGRVIIVVYKWWTQII